MGGWHSARRLLAATEEEEEYYTGEACAYFALALQGLFGYPIRMLVDEGATAEWDGEEMPYVVHVYATDSGDAVDIKGRRSEADMRSDFFDLVDPATYDLSSAELESEWMGDDLPLHAPSEPEVAEAKAVIMANPDIWAPDRI